MEKRCALTTIDNPFNPFTEFDKWFVFDEDMGYHTCAYIARITHTSNQMSDEENNAETERAIDEIIRYDFRHIYKKVYAEG